MIERSVRTTVPLRLRSGKVFLASPLTIGDLFGIVEYARMTFVMNAISTVRFSDDLNEIRLSAIRDACEKYSVDSLDSVFAAINGHEGSCMLSYMLIRRNSTISLSEWEEEFASVDDFSYNKFIFDSYLALMAHDEMESEQSGKKVSECLRKAFNMLPETGVHSYRIMDMTIREVAFELNGVEKKINTESVESARADYEKWRTTRTSN